MVSDFSCGVYGRLLNVNYENQVVLCSSVYFDLVESYCKQNDDHRFEYFIERLKNKKYSENIIDKIKELRECFRKNITENSGSMNRIALHETLHIGERAFCPTAKKLIPKEHVQAAKNTSEYAYLSNPKELFTEIMTDKLINKNLSPEKEALLKFFNNGDR